MRVIVLLIVMLGLVAQSCGSRKVEKHSKSSLEETNTSLQEQTKVTEIQFDRKKVFEIMRELNVRKGEITIQSDGTIHIKGDEIDLNSKEAGGKLESGLIKEANTSFNIGQDLIKKDDQNDVRIDRKQFNWWGVIIPIVIFGFLIYAFRKPLKKIILLFS